MDPITLDLVTKAGFAGLCIWLIWDTRKEARQREERMSVALERANTELAEHSEHSTAALKAVAAATQRLADVLQTKPCVASDSSLQEAVKVFKQETDCK